MNLLNLMIIGFGALLLLVAVLAPAGGWNIYVMILGGAHILVGNILAFREISANFRANTAPAPETEGQEARG